MAHMTYHVKLNPKACVVKEIIIIWDTCDLQMEMEKFDIFLWFNSVFTPGASKSTLVICRLKLSNTKLHLEEALLVWNTEEISCVV